VPIYEYQCPKEDCGGRVEKLLKTFEMNESVKCPKCGRPMKRMISKSSFLLKGGGWASDGYSG